MRFNKIEVKELIIVTIILGFLFSFRLWDDGIGHVLFTWFRFFVVAMISLLIYVMAQKKLANKLGMESEYSIWSIRRLSLSSKSKNPFPIGIIIALVLIFISNGKLIWAALGSTMLNLKRVRFGSKYNRIGESEAGKIALMGPLVSLLLAFIFKAIGWGEFVTVNSYLAVFNMLPFPGLEGCKLFFGSKILYIFSLIFIVVSVVLLQSVGVLASLLFALLIAALITILYSYFKI